MLGCSPGAGSGVPAAGSATGCHDIQGSPASGAERTQGQGNGLPPAGRPAQHAAWSESQQHRRLVVLVEGLRRWNGGGRPFQRHEWVAVRGRVVRSQRAQQLLDHTGHAPCIRPGNGTVGVGPCDGIGDPPAGRRRRQECTAALRSGRPAVGTCPVGASRAVTPATAAAAGRGPSPAGARPAPAAFAVFSSQPRQKIAGGRRGVVGEAKPTQVVTLDQVYLLRHGAGEMAYGALGGLPRRQAARWACPPVCKVSSQARAVQEMPGLHSFTIQAAVPWSLAVLLFLPPILGPPLPNTHTHTHPQSSRTDAPARRAGPGPGPACVGAGTAWD